MLSISVDHHSELPTNLFHPFNKNHVSIHDGKNATCRHYIGCESGSCGTIHCTRVSKKLAEILQEEGFKI